MRHVEVERGAAREPPGWRAGQPPPTLASTRHRGRDHGDLSHFRCGRCERHPEGADERRAQDTAATFAALLGAVMMAESGGESVGLFRLHARGMGRGLGDLRYDPELNASIGTRALADGWHEGLRQGYAGDELVRFAYDYRFNPGGGFQWQGDAVLSHYRFYSAIAERAGGDPGAGEAAA